MTSESSSTVIGPKCCSGCGAYLGLAPTYVPWLLYCEMACTDRKNLMTNERDAAIAAIFTECNLHQSRIGAYFGLTRQHVNAILKVTGALPQSVPKEILQQEREAARAAKVTGY